MNVRRIVMVMLVLGFMVQGASATSGVINADCPAFTNLVSENNYVDVPDGVYYYTAFTEVYSLAEWGSTAVASSGDTTTLSSTSDASFSDYVDPEYGSNEASGTITTTRFRVTCDQSMYNQFAPTYAYSSITYSDILPLTASGSSCLGVGVFDIYIGGVYNFTDSQGGNYSFFISAGVDYQIKYTNNNESEWYNFTASTEDVTWSPDCPLPSISGTITALDGEGIYNMEIFLHDWYLYERDLIETTFTDTNGSYNFYVQDEGVYSLAVSGYCNSGSNCSVAAIYNPISVINGSNLIYDYTWHIPANLRIDLQYENGTAVSNALLHIKDLPASVGTWRTTATDGYTTYTSMQTSRVYVDYHGGDGSTAASDVLHSFRLTPNGQYRRSQFTLTIPDDFANNTTIPPAPPVLDEANLTDITQMDSDGTFLVTVRDSVSSNPLKDATVTVTAADKNYTGQHKGFTNASGQWSFAKNNTVGQYDISVALTCYIPQTITRYSSATFDLEYSCGPPPGTDENGTGGWDDGSANWTYNGTLESENDMKAKVTSFMYIVVMGIGVVLLLTYFIKK